MGMQYCRRHHTVRDHDRHLLPVRHEYRSPYYGWCFGRGRRIRLGTCRMKASLQAAGELVEIGGDWENREYNVGVVVEVSRC